jgi:formylglycine-generating enzyme required for sulfatase activity
MPVHKLLLAAAALGLGLFASAALAIQPVVIKTSEQERQDTVRKIEAQMQKSFALLIGVSEFDSRSWPALPGVATEIAGMQALFEAKGFEIAPESHISGPLGIEDMRVRINAFIAAHKGHADHRLVIYIATHGYADPDHLQPNGKADGFLIASDAGIPDKGQVPNGFSVRDFSSALYDVDPQHIFVFLDSCFSGSMLPAPTRAGAEALANKPAEALSKETADWTLHLLSQSARMILTAGGSDQTVLDRDNPFPKAIADGLAGAADGDGDGLILGSELAQFVRGRVARETRLLNHPNDPVFAVIPRIIAPANPRPDAPPDVDYAQLGDFIFLNPGGAAPLAQAGIDERAALLAERQARLGGNEFTECVDCPTMTRLPGPAGNIALAKTETTYAEWDACFRALACRRYLPDDGFGRGDRPATNMTWLDAQDYVAWLNRSMVEGDECGDYRLPTVNEWLAAATWSSAGPVTWRAAVADSEPVCLGCGAGMDGLAAARTGSTPPDDAGLYDMIGNVWEWVDGDPVRMSLASPEGVDRAVAAADAAATETCDTNALGVSDTCSDGIVMGGSYATDANALPLRAWGPMPRTGIRRPYALPTVGMRVACTLN